MGWSRLDGRADGPRPRRRRPCLFRAQLRLPRRPRDRGAAAAYGAAAIPAASGTALGGARNSIPSARRLPARASSRLPRSMILLPAIDLIGGRCVRLAQGDFARETRYSDDPAAALAAIRRGGARGGASRRSRRRAGARAAPARSVRRARRASAPLKLQVAGGFRTARPGRADARRGRRARGDRQPRARRSRRCSRAMLERFGPDRLTLALDVRLVGRRRRWSRRTAGSPRSAAETLDDGARPLSRGPPFAGHRHRARRHARRAESGADASRSSTPIRRRAAGLGRRRRARRPCRARAAGAARAIVGKAIWEGRFTVAEGLAHARG